VRPFTLANVHQGAVVLTFLTKILKSKTPVDAKIEFKGHTFEPNFFPSKIQYANKKAEFDANLSGKICNKIKITRKRCRPKTFPQNNKFSWIFTAVVR
jgi:hypothetical protein